MATIVKIIAAADLHRRKCLYEDLASAVQLHRPDVVALVGDFLHDGDQKPALFSEADCARFLCDLSAPEIVFVRGNHEDDAWSHFEAAWRKTGRPLNALHGEVFHYGPLALTGFPCSLGLEDAFLGGREPLPDDGQRMVPGLA
jgi:predicted phosphodiesterase